MLNGLFSIVSFLALSRDIPFKKMNRSLLVSEKGSSGNKTYEIFFMQVHQHAATAGLH